MSSITTVSVQGDVFVAGLPPWNLAICALVSSNVDVLHLFRANRSLRKVLVMLHRHANRLADRQTDRHRLAGEWSGETNGLKCP